MTQALAETGADIKSVEIDESLLPILRKTLEGYDNVEIIHGDILKVDLKDITGKAFYSGGEPALLHYDAHHLFPA